MAKNNKSKKELKFKSVESLQSVVDIVNESACALHDKTRTIHESAIPEVLIGALGAGIGGVGSFVALYGLGTVGLSAAAGGMVAGIFVLAAPVAVLAGAGVGVATALKNKQLKKEKERLDYLQSLNILLQHAIKDLKVDLGIA